VAVEENLGAVAEGAEAVVVAEESQSWVPRAAPNQARYSPYRTNLELHNCRRRACFPNILYSRRGYRGGTTVR
jgi:hypothetical protein